MRWIQRAMAQLSLSNFPKAKFCDRQYIYTIKKKLYGEINWKSRYSSEKLVSFLRINYEMLKPWHMGAKFDIMHPVDKRVKACLISLTVDIVPDLAIVWADNNRNHRNLVIANNSP